MTSDNSGTAPLAPSPELLIRGVNSVARKGFEKARQVWRGCGCAEGDANLARLLKNFFFFLDN